MGISTVFANFRMQNCSVQIKKIKDGIFSLQLKKITSAKRLQTILDLKMYPPTLDLTRILKSYRKMS